MYHNKAAHDLKPLKVNDKVFVKKDLSKPNVPDKITKVCDRPRSN